jgi:putative transposase
MTTQPERCALSHLARIGRGVRVTACGRICIGRRKINLSTVFAGQWVGIREVEDKIWLVSFLDFDLGYFDELEGRVEPGPNPFEAKVLTMSSV